MAQTRFWKTAAAAGLGALLCLGAAQAEEAPDSGVFQKIIKNQMTAFASGNAKAAFSFATNSLQQQFQTPEFFMEMVRQGYQPVFRPKSVTFGQSKMTKLGPTQEVYVTGPKGKNWLALYSFEKQDDGSWRISGCYLTKSDGISA
ncbi:DUF4864 domain-containing protein [Roseibium porphyridii]|uniref:DUF4864 domain-containing protein n=1 Tax=Roseibium porphyridii TaxID=2866279 RepID=A0ABY8EX24_9HYPH|nr:MULTISPECIES: DUF4864 domain-containing protein [Stappiaceae]QFT32176.1 hypothetical protein FIV00_16920 [Labrenzia sp. THAF82]WFE87553.1 DUF4864 domain-containing protein [Roseibium sp. KMA01]